MFRRKQQNAPMSAPNPCPPATVLSPRRLTAAEAHTLVHPGLVAHDAAARLILIISETVYEMGVADDWRFLYLLPGVHSDAEAVVTAIPDGNGAFVVTARCEITLVPKPGSTDALMAQTGGTATHMVEERWQARVSRLAGLDVPFVDSGHALAALDAQGAHALSGGLARMKARMLPTGANVWEIANMFGTYQVPLSPARWVFSNP